MFLRRSLCRLRICSSVRLRMIRSLLLFRVSVVRRSLFAWDLCRVRLSYLFPWGYLTCEWAPSLRASVWYRRLWWLSAILVVRVLLLNPTSCKLRIRSCRLVRIVGWLIIIAFSRWPRLECLTCRRFLMLQQKRSVVVLRRLWRWAYPTVFTRLRWFAVPLYTPRLAMCCFCRLPSPR